MLANSVAQPVSSNWCLGLGNMLINYPLVLCIVTQGGCFLQIVQWQEVVLLFFESATDGASSLASSGHLELGIITLGNFGNFFSYSTAPETTLSLADRCLTFLFGTMTTIFNDSTVPPCGSDSEWQLQNKNMTFSSVLYNGLKKTKPWHLNRGHILKR